MENIVSLERILMNEDHMTEEVVNEWIFQSDISNMNQFFNVDAATSFAAVQNISNIIVTRHLNNRNKDEVSLHLKTKLCILLNNFALYSPVRQAVFRALDKLTSVFETSIKEESKMPFESELGRMSEHVLVLLMRCTDYQLKAAAVHEFTEGQTKFAIQLLLAILLKEPAYEFELRCNCISGIYGFTLPQTFFSPGDNNEENSCTNFTEKINFILYHMTRLKAMLVVNDVLKQAMLVGSTSPAILRRGFSDMMRSIMNISKFSSEGSSQWRKHIMHDTKLMEEAVGMHIESLVLTLEKRLMEVTFVVPMDLLKALLLSFRFCVFATFNIGGPAVQLKSTYNFYIAFKLPIQSLLADARQSGVIMAIYTSILHFMCNINALDDDVRLKELPIEMRSKYLTDVLAGFLDREVASCGMPLIQAWQKQFLESNLEWPCEKGNITYQTIKALFAKLVQRQQPVVAAAAVRAPLPLPLLPGKAAPGIDASFRCMLSGELMKHPMKSPYGHIFEEAAIMDWLKQNGSICPITGKPLVGSQLVPDAATGVKIMQQIVAQSMATEMTEDDLYNF